MSTFEVIRVLQVAPCDVVSVLERRAGELCVTRYYAHPVRREHDAAVSAFVLTAGARPAVPQPIADALEGYRVRVSLRAMPGVPRVLAAGVHRMMLPGLPPLAGQYGNAYVSLRSYPGTSLLEARDQLSTEERRAVLAATVRIVAGLHARGVTHGSLRPEVFAAAGGAVTLAVLDGLRSIVDEVRVAGDRDAIAALAAWLLGGEAPDAATLDALWTTTPVANDATISVPDEPPSETVFVPDDPE